MESLFLIYLNIKTPSGFEPYVTYNIGEKREVAKTIFDKLKGSTDISGTTLFTMDFIEMKDGVTLPINILDCTFDDIVFNTRLITREIFKYLNLEKD